MAPWADRDEWFNKDRLTVPYSELWHGSRFRELSYFFDEYNEFVLPALCTICNSVFSPETIEELCNFNPQHGQKINATCQECHENTEVEVQITTGHPLNQVFLFHEDG